MGSWRKTSANAAPSLAALLEGPNVERAVPPRLLRLDRLQREEEFRSLSALARLAYEIDSLAAMALVSRERGLVFPEIVEGERPFVEGEGVYHPLLEGAKYGGYIVIVDLDEVAYRYLANDSVSRDTKLLPNRQENDRDGRKSEWLTECGGQWGQEKTHSLITGITS